VDLQNAFPLDILMVTSQKLPFIANSNILTGVTLAPGEMIYFGSLGITADPLGHLSLSPNEWDSRAIFIGMVHNKSASLHTTLEDSSDEGSTTSDVG
jgi:hypothetical protein